MLVQGFLGTIGDDPDFRPGRGELRTLHAERGWCQRTRQPPVVCQNLTVSACAEAPICHPSFCPTPSFNLFQATLGRALIDLGLICILATLCNLKKVFGDGREQAGFNDIDRECLQAAGKSEVPISPLPPGPVPGLDKTWRDCDKMVLNSVPWLRELTSLPLSAGGCVTRALACRSWFLTLLPG